MFDWLSVFVFSVSQRVLTLRSNCISKKKSSSNLSILTFDSDRKREVRAQSLPVNPGNDL